MLSLTSPPSTAVEGRGSRIPDERCATQRSARVLDARVLHKGVQMSNVLRPPLLKRWKFRSRAAARLLAVGTTSALCFGTLGTPPASAQVPVTPSPEQKTFDHYLFA